MSVVWSVLYLVLLLFMICLFIRLVFDWVQIFSRDWRPKGLALVLAEAVYTVTDPPLKALRRVIPPLRLGPVALDVGFLILVVGCTILLNVLQRLA